MTPDSKHPAGSEADGLAGWKPWLGPGEADSMASPCAECGRPFGAHRSSNGQCPDGENPEEIHAPKKWLETKWKKPPEPPGPDEVWVVFTEGGIIMDAFEHNEDALLALEDGWRVVRYAKVKP